MKIELYADGMPFPEGPVFGPDGCLYVCCRRAGWIARVDENRRVSRVVDTGGKPQALTSDGKLMYLADAVRKQILTLKTDGKLQVLIADDRLIGPNDLCLGPALGNLYFTDPGLEWGVYVGNIYRYEMNTKKLTRLARGLGFPNGLAISADESRVYFAETLSNRLMQIDLSSAEERAPELVFDFGADAVPDGMEWLDHGCRYLAVALHGAGCISVVDTKRGSEARLSLGPQAHPTNLIPNDRGMFVTDDSREAVLLCTDLPQLEEY